MDLSLFPKKEEWGTGDEAMDNRLSIALKNTISDLSFKSISEFYFSAILLRPRAYNPAFSVTIEHVTKALFYFLTPLENIDHLVKKMKGDYYSKSKISFDFQEKNLVMNELELTRKCRYKDQIDFSVNLQNPSERNPFVKEVLKRSGADLSVKMIFKDFKKFLNEDPNAELFSDSLFIALRGGRNILLIEGFAEIWFHQDQFFALNLNELNNL